MTRTVFLGDLSQAHVDWGGRELVVRHTHLPVEAGQDAFLHADPGTLRVAGGGVAGLPKRRADQALVDLGLVETRSRAQALIMAGQVWAGDRRVGKPGDLIAEGLPLEVRGHDHPWASRGGLKLDHALRHFGLSPAGRICLDVGASTGGFTSVLLAGGAARVHAVDVGHGQLAWSLRNDPRVVVHERVNARHLTRDQIPDPVDALVCDASFIGLATILPAPLALCAPGAWAVALIKPQFEAGPGLVGKGGIVRDPDVHRAVCDRIEAWWSQLDGWQVLGLTDSPVAGAEGNREFLISARYLATRPNAPVAVNLFSTLRHASFLAR